MLIFLVNKSFDFNVHKFHTTLGFEEDDKSINFKIEICHTLSGKVVLVALAKGEKFDYSSSTLKIKIHFFIFIFFIGLNLRILEICHGEI
jgi:hypothetical protein